RSHADYAACVRLQRETWGETFSETVPPAILQVAQKVGGIAGGAFDGNQLVGFVFGITGIQDGAPVHWSDMLAVRASHQNRRIGEQLKWYQRDLLLERGITRALWTFDPLQTKNAHINFARLGITAREYVIDMYGETDSPLHAAGTDRLIAIWDLTSERVRARAQNRTPRPYPVDVRIEIPAVAGNIEELRAQTRAEFTRYLPDYVVTDFVRGEKSAYYALTSGPSLSR
ncbi:MAG TPA: GNAT family N-acetyltransferase, partial [Longimicrobiales bacterium]